MTLTQQQRLDIYRKAIEDYRQRAQHTHVGFCNYMCMKVAPVFVISDLAIKQYFPELYLQKPDGRKRSYWFKKKGPIPERIACIEAAIKLCEEQLKTTDNEK